LRRGPISDQRIPIHLEFNSRYYEFIRAISNIAYYKPRVNNLGSFELAVNRARFRFRNGRTGVGISPPHSSVSGTLIARKEVKRETGSTVQDEWVSSAAGLKTPMRKISTNCSTRSLLGKCKIPSPTSRFCVTTKLRKLP
jgi:hypothetical protein